MNDLVQWVETSSRGKLYFIFVHGGLMKYSLVMQVGQWQGGHEMGLLTPESRRENIVLYLMSYILNIEYSIFHI